jgi:predicted nucleotidyltransferase
MAGRCIMNKKMQKVAVDLKRDISAKYELLDFKVFGSTARDDCRPESDIDIFVLLPHVERYTEEDLFNIAYDLELKYDCLIDLIVFGKDELEAGLSKTPLYRQVVEEGIAV